jgi:hypothetical protein
MNPMKKARRGRPVRSVDLSTPCDLSGYSSISIVALSE